MKIFRLVKDILFVLLGISIFFLKEIYVENLRFFIGSLITLYAICGAFECFLNKGHNSARIFCKSLVEFIIGISTLVLFEKFETICVVWAIWAIMREADEINECYELFKEKIPFVFGFIESVVAIVFSITLIMEPGEHHAMIHMYLLIVELITAVVFPRTRELYVKVFKKEEETKEEE